MAQPHGTPQACLSILSADFGGWGKGVVGLRHLHARSRTGISRKTGMPAAKRIQGYEAAEVIGRHFRNVLICRRIVRKDLARAIPPRAVRKERLKAEAGYRKEGTKLARRSSDR